MGLAIAAEVARPGLPLVLLERNVRYGQETSSRNSEVIHAGMYYPEGSLKARLCVEGNRLLYELCEAHGIPHRRITKIITAAAPAEMEALEQLHARGRANGVPLEMLSGERVRELEPRIVSAGGLLSPTTGIISAHALMDHFARTAERAGAVLQTRCAVVAITPQPDGYAVRVDEAGPMQTDSSASFTYLASRSASECTTTVLMPSSRQARCTRKAISPRLAIRIFSNMGSRTSKHEESGLGRGNRRALPPHGINR